MNWKTDLYSGFVNLSHRTDRLTHMQRQLSTAGIDAVRFNGILPNDPVCQDSKYNVMRNRTPGAIGCHISQVNIMKSALNGDKHAFVMEDDLVFCQDIQKRLDYISQWLSCNEWDVFWMGGTFHNPPFWHPVGPSKMKPNCSANLGKDFEKTSDERIVRTYGAFCTYAYLVNKNSIQKILDLFDRHIHESIGIDWLFIKLQPQLRCFAFVPGSVKQMDNQSDIGDGITRFSGFAQLNGSVENSRYWYQERMEDFNPKDL